MADVPTVPHLPGLAYRHWAGEDDFPAMVDVLNKAWPAIGIESADTVEGMRATYGNLTNCDLTKDLLLAEVDGALVAYSRVEWRDAIEGGRRYHLIGFIDPAWHRRGLGTAMQAWNEQRLGEIAVGHERHESDVLETWATDRDPGGQEILKRAGFAAATYNAEMVRSDLDDLPHAPMPDGLIVRTPEPHEMRTVWEAEAEAFRDHWGEVEPTEGDYQWFLDFPWNDPALWRVAWDGDQVAGMVRSFINTAENLEFGRKRGYTEFISTRRPYRRRGLARALLCQSLHAIRERGMEEGALGVHIENPRNALGLYEGVGFKTTMITTTYHKPMT